MIKTELIPIELRSGYTEKNTTILVFLGMESHVCVEICLSEKCSEELILLSDKKQKKRISIYDLFINEIEGQGKIISELIIDNFYEGNFFCSLIITSQESIKSIATDIDDAIAIALKTGTPIYIDKDLLDIVGYTPCDLNFDDLIEQKINQSKYGGLTVQELNDLIDLLVSKEEYEEAAIVLEELETRQNK